LDLRSGWLIGIHVVKKPDAAKKHYSCWMSSAGNALTIFIVSRLTVITRRNSSSG
jgi:hypothetical protein